MSKANLQLSLFDEAPQTVAPTLDVDPNVIAIFGPLPERLLLMHEVFGSTPGWQCFGCSHLKTRPGRPRCNLYLVTDGPDGWTASWPACGRRVDRSQI